MAEGAVVLRDSEGNYYLLDKQALQAARVPADQVAGLEEALEPEVVGHTVATIEVAGWLHVRGSSGSAHVDFPPHFDTTPHFDTYR